MIISEKYELKTKTITDYKKLTDIKKTWKEMFGNEAEIIETKQKRVIAIVPNKTKSGEKTIIIYREKTVRRKI